MKIFHVFTCTRERMDGTPCGWPTRVGKGRVPRRADGRRAEEIEDFCKRCRGQGRVQEGERCTFCFVRQETKDRRPIEEISLAYSRSLTGFG